MIARIWHGYTKPEHANAYESMLKPELLPGISKVKGYHGSYLLRREAGAESSSSPSCFGIRLTQSGPWQGRIMKRLSFPQERRKYLSRYNAKSAHYEIASIHKPAEVSSIPL